MHRTLKRQAITPVRANRTARQRDFDAFRQEYNEERPHERLQQETPASHYQSSPRAYPERLPALEYPGHFQVKRITTAGTFRCGSLMSPPFNELTFVANHGGTSDLSYLLQNAIELLPAAARCTFREVLTGHERRHLLGQCGGNQLIDRDILALS